MTIFNIPSTPNFVRSSFQLQSNTQTFASPINRSIQTSEMVGARWIGSYTLPFMKRPSAGLWQSFLIQCRGAGGRFFGFDPDGRPNIGAGSGSPLINGGGQTGNSLTTDGWDPAVEGALMPGDYFSVNGELKMITQQIDVDENGFATLVFEPSLRYSPPDNAVINITDPTCIMRLQDDNQALWEVNHNGLYSLSFTGIEVFT